ncbi:AGAP007353-PA-like protein [Anopheles sinensis]|uniref:AGAP007353-PA-like protein n=1 Tax=Anopheles sinensis TaxID=74873 RepID=A0A084VD50_ANOSI|nr:AGAP007353-PA-like protein [Anopheles sinensis]
MAYQEAVNKRPQVYAPYESTLDDVDLKVAIRELHETDDTREPSIAQIREFIAKHPQIVRCRTDPVYLLRFLRYKKFNVTEACAMLESTLAFFMRMRVLYGEEIDSFHPNVQGMVDLGVMVPLGYDRNKRVVILNRVGAYPKTTSALMQMRLGALVISTCLEYEQTQVYGSVWIMDFSGMTMSHVAMWGLTELKMLADSVNDIVTMMVKEIHMVQVPKMTWMLIDMVLPLLSPKIRNRFKFHRTLDDLCSAVDPSILPCEYGGERPLEKANDDFRAMFDEQRKWFMLEEHFFMDLTIPAPGSSSTSTARRNDFRDEESMVGSFRKLTVD